MPCGPLCWGWARSEAPHMASHGAHTASTRREDALECVLLGVGAFTGLNTSPHTRHIPRPHGANMPWSAFCWGWARSEAPHIASHRSDFASTRREYALECVLLRVGRSQASTHRLTRATFCVHTARICPGVCSVGGGAFRGSTHRVTRVTFRAHTARRCPGVRSVGGGAFTGLNTSPHTHHILRPHGANMPWSVFCWGWARSEAPHMASHASHSASTRREDALECVLLGVGAFRGSTHRVTRWIFVP